METLTPPTLPIPVHPGLPFLGNTFEFARDPIRAILTYRQRYDRVVRLRFGGRTQHLLFRPEDVKQVLQENNRNYGRSPAFGVLRIFLGNGLLTSEGDFWRRQRRLAQPAFHRQKLVLLAETMVHEATGWIKRLKEENLNQPVNVSASLMDVTMRIVCKTLFGSDVGTNLNGLSVALEKLNYLANKRLLNPFRLPMHWPTPDNLSFRRSARLVDNLIYGFIQQRRTTGQSHDDLLDMLLNAEDEETGERMSDGQLRDECVTLFSAGHETTAVAMGWTLHLLARHPDVLARLVAEADAVLGDEPMPDPARFRALTYTMQVVQESMRLYPPAWIMSRLALSDDQFGPYTVPAQTTVLVSPYLLHRDPTYWPNPERFNPDRFAPGQERERHPYAYLPFGGGPRLCIGNQFALTEMQILLGLFARSFSIRPEPKHVTVGMQPLITLRPKRPIRLRLSER